MNSTATITTLLNEYMKRENLSLSQFAKQIGLNAGSLSYILSGNRTMNCEQLDHITEGIGLPKGYFYDQYYEEVVAPAIPNWRRIKPFIYSCAEVGNLNCIQKTVQLLLDNLMYSQFLFEVAEDLCNNGNKDAAIILYENVALSEKSQHSERLALCHYRLFMCKLANNQEKNYQAAIQFELFVDRLDEYDQLDALKDLANTYRSLRRWDKVEEMAEKLREKADFQYNKRTRFDTGHKPSRPLFVYLAYSYLLLGNVYENKGDFEKTLQCIGEYADLGWVTENDEKTLFWKEKFLNWAKINTIVTRLTSGDISVLPTYMAYIESNKDELLLFLLNVVETANRYNFDVDNILQRFDLSVVTIEDYSNNIYSQKTMRERLARFYYELAYYTLYKGKYTDGFTFLIGSLEKSLLINEKNCIIKCVGLFENFREYCDPEATIAYQKLIAEVYKNEKKAGNTAVG